MKAYIKKRRQKKKVKQFKNAHSKRADRHSIRSFHPKKAAKQSTKGNSKVLKWLKKDVWAVCGIIVFAGVGVWYFGFHNAAFALKQISVEGVQFLNQSDVNRVIDEYRTSEIFGLIQRNNYWSFNTSALEKRIESEFAESFALESVSVEKEWPNSIFVQINERIPSVTWVTKNAARQERFYSVDRDGYVTQSIPSFDQVDPSFPRIRDDNRDELQIGWQIVSNAYIEFLMQVHEEFEKQAAVEVDSYVFPYIECQEQQYVTEKIFQQEILESASEEFREKKRAIQEQFQRGELTIDDSLDALEAIKQEELVQMGEDVESGFERMEWETVFVPIECDFVSTGNDLHLVTTGENGGFKVYFDTKGDVSLQIQNLVSVLHEKVEDRKAIKYIDVRVPDRVYFQ